MEVGCIKQHLDIAAVQNKRVFETDTVGYFFNDPVSLEGQLGLCGPINLCIIKTFLHFGETSSLFRSFGKSF